MNCYLLVLMKRLRHLCLMVLFLAPIGCRLDSRDGQRMDMPASNVPLNAALPVIYKGKNFIDPSGLQSEFATLRECESEDSSEKDSSEDS